MAYRKTASDTPVVAPMPRYGRGSDAVPSLPDSDGFGSGEGIASSDPHLLWVVRDADVSQVQARCRTTSQYAHSTCIWTMVERQVLISQTIVMSCVVA